MKDWKWASVRGCPDLMMAAKSHSMSSALVSALLTLIVTLFLTFV